MDTLFADVSEFQVPVTTAYPHKWLSIRSNDGTYRDHNWRQNWRTARDMLNSGQLDGLIVYFVCRPNWQDSVNTHIDMLGGTPTDKVVSMIDAESWEGQIVGDHSFAFNGATWALHDFYGGEAGNPVPRRVIGYLNPNDHSVWPNRPEMPFVVPSYGAPPRFTRWTEDLGRKMFAHQYTDGKGFGHGLPEGAPPFGNCDMNAANGYDSAALVNLLLQTKGDPVMPTSWADTLIPTQYVNDNGVVRQARDDETNSPNRIYLPAWQLFSWLDGRVARAEGSLADINAKLDSLLDIVHGLQ